MKQKHTLEVDINLLKKYQQPGPRYTSYPTAPNFSSKFTSEDFRRELTLSNKEGDLKEISLYFHFPFCKTLCYYCGCNIIITHNPRRIERYLDYLKKEIDLFCRLINPTRKVVQLHWGGGTPTYLSTHQIRDIFGYIQKRFNFSANAEISIEIDPRRLTEEHLPVLREIGFNRVSFGLQDFNPKVQEAVNRIQPYQQNEYVIAESRRLNFDSINVDLIYGLPFQTLESYQETLDTVIELFPDRLAVFNYAHVPWLKKHQNLLPQEAMPNATARLNLLKMIIERLTAAGYVYIGMDHFAKSGDTLTKALQNHSLYRNFQGYSTHSQAEVLAMGVTAISQLDHVYAQNVKEMKNYEEMIDGGIIPTSVGYKLTKDDHLRRYVITELMCNNRVIKKQAENKYGISFDRYFPDIDEKLEKFLFDDLIEIKPDRIEVKEAGRLVIRNIAMAFDAYLDQKAPEDKPVYSRTV